MLKRILFQSNSSSLTNHVVNIQIASEPTNFNLEFYVIAHSIIKCNRGISVLVKHIIVSTSYSFGVIKPYRLMQETMPSINFCYAFAFASV